MNKFMSRSVSQETVNKVLEFRDERNWKQFHNPKDLAISISLEASELLECFQWSGSDTEVLSKRDNMQEELSDILIYSLLLADRLDIDLNKAIQQKIELNNKKYPVEKSYGRSEKYNQM